MKLYRQVKRTFKINWRWPLRRQSWGSLTLTRLVVEQDSTLQWLAVIGYPPAKRSVNPSTSPFSMLASPAPKGPPAANPCSRGSKVGGLHRCTRANNHSANWGFPMCLTSMFFQTMGGIRRTQSRTHADTRLSRDQTHNLLDVRRLTLTHGKNMKNTMVEFCGLLLQYTF